MTIEQREALLQLVEKWKDRADAECQTRGPGWVGADATLRACADELDELLVAMVQEGWVRGRE